MTYETAKIGGVCTSELMDLLGELSKCGNTCPLLLNGTCAYIHSSSIGQDIPFTPESKNLLERYAKERGWKVSYI